MSLVMADVSTGPFRLHELVFRNDFRKLDEALKINNDDIEQVDTRNRTPLMLAVVLVWQEAIAVGDPELVQLALETRQEQLATNHNVIANVLARLRDAPDFYVEMRWEFSSWVPFVSRMCPSDTCRIWKSGTAVRIDTTLLGFENDKWERGNQSFLFLIDERSSSALSIVVDHDQAEVFCERTRLPPELVRGLTRVPEPTPPQAAPAAAPESSEAAAQQPTQSSGAPHDVALLDLGSAPEVASTEPHVPAVDLDSQLLDAATGGPHPAYITERYVAAKMSQPLISTYLDTESITFERTKSGILGWRSDKSEVVSGFPSKVYSASNVQLVTVIRTEHLSKEDKARFQQKMAGTAGGQSNPLASLFGLAEKAAAASRDNKAGSPARDDDTVATNPLLAATAEQELTFSEYIESGKLSAAQKRRTSPTHEQVVRNAPLRDVGRTREASRKVQSFTLKAWLADEHPLNLHSQLLPVVELMAHANGGHFDKLKTFISLQLPAGFPVKIEVPLYVVVNARITFANVFGLDSPVAGVRCVQTFEKLAGATVNETAVKEGASQSTAPLSINSGDIVERKRTQSQTQRQSSVSTSSSTAESGHEEQQQQQHDHDPAIAKFKTVVKCTVDPDVFKIPAHYAGAEALDARLLSGTPVQRAQRVAPRSRQQRLQFENDDAMLQYALQLSLSDYQRQSSGQGNEDVAQETAPAAVDDDWELQRAIAESLRISEEAAGGSNADTASAPAAAAAVAVAVASVVPAHNDSPAVGNGNVNPSQRNRAAPSRATEPEIDEQTRLAMEISEQERLEDERRRKAEEEELERVLKLSEVDK